MSNRDGAVNIEVVGDVGRARLEAATRETWRFVPGRMVLVCDHGIEVAVEDAVNIVFATDRVLDGIGRWHDSKRNEEAGTWISQIRDRSLALARR